MTGPAGGAPAPSKALADAQVPGVGLHEALPGLQNGRTGNFSLSRLNLAVQSKTGGRTMAPVTKPRRPAQTPTSGRKGPTGERCPPLPTRLQHGSYKNKSARLRESDHAGIAPSEAPAPDPVAMDVSNRRGSTAIGRSFTNRGARLTLTGGRCAACATWFSRNSATVATGVAERTPIATVDGDDSQAASVRPYRSEMAGTGIASIREPLCLSACSGSMMGDVQRKRVVSSEPPTAHARQSCVVTTLSRNTP